MSRPGLRPCAVGVYVDGCFWHSCPEHGTRPKANAEFWNQKLDRERDAETNRRLKSRGWQAIRVWKHEDLTEAANQIGRVVHSSLKNSRAA